MTAFSIQECRSVKSARVIQRLSDDLELGIVQFDKGIDSVEYLQGNNDIKFHFSVEGDAVCSVPGKGQLEFGDFAAALVVHGHGIEKRLHTRGRTRTLTATIGCKSSVLVDRLGIAPSKLPRPVRQFVQTGRGDWFGEVIRMTPGMVSAVRSLATMPFDGRMGRAYREARSIELMCELCNAIGAVASQRPVIQAKSFRRAELTKAIIDQNISARLNIIDLSRAVGTNESELSHSFRETYGVTVFDYVTSVRMSTARTLLQSTDRPISEIAKAVGHEYHGNFSVAFKRHFGVTPKQCRIQSSVERP